jgi:hypothetical protein
MKRYRRFILFFCSMWLFTFHVVPRPGSPAITEFGGAYVNCWILYAWQDGAEVLARYEVEKEWIITETVAVSWYDPGEILKSDDHFEYYEQATIDGGVFVYDTYPVEAEDEEDFELDDAASRNSKSTKTNH